MSTRKMLLEVDLVTGNVVVLPHSHRSSPSSGAAGSVVQPAAPLWETKTPPPPPSPVEAPHTSPPHEKPPLPLDLQPKPDAWARLISDLLDGAELWEGFQGMTPQAILATPGVRAEVSILQTLGLSNALELVLRCGPRRVKQVRVWADKVSKRQRVSNVGGLIAATLLRGQPNAKKT